MTYYIESIDQNSRMALEQAILNWPEELRGKAVIIEMKVTSAQMSKNLRKQEVIAMLDRIPSSHDHVADGEWSNTARTDGYDLSEDVDGWIIVDRFLTEFEVPKKDQLNPDLIQEVQVAQMVQQQMEQMGQQIQKLQQQLAATTGQFPPGRWRTWGPPGMPCHNRGSWTSWNGVTGPVPQ